MIAIEEPPVPGNLIHIKVEQAPLRILILQVLNDVFINYKLNWLMVIQMLEKLFILMELKILNFILSILS